MEFLSQLDLGALGVSGILIAFLFYQNWELKKDLREAQKYSRQVNEERRQDALSLQETLRKFEQAILILREALKK